MQQFDIVVNRVAYSGCGVETGFYLAKYLYSYLDSQNLDQDSKERLSPVAIDVPNDIKAGDVTCQVFLRLRDPSLNSEFIDGLILLNLNILTNVIYLLSQIN